MHTGTVFENNRTQAVRLPVDVRFDDSVKKVVIRKLGKDRILTPVDHVWDSFFHATDGVSEDFSPERASQQQAEREEFERVAGLWMENWMEQ
ncbi:MAG: type II toxin-antitoxin system VapB family antitoxin [Thiopseudomonas sp.]